MAVSVDVELVSRSRLEFFASVTAVPAFVTAVSVEVEEVMRLVLDV